MSKLNTSQQNEDKHQDQEQLKDSKTIAQKIPDIVTSSILLKSVPLPDSTPKVQGYNFNQWDPTSPDSSFYSLFNSYGNMGFQATSFHRATQEIHKMLDWNLSHSPFDPTTEPKELQDPEVRSKIKTTIFLGYTSNLISCGLRETLCWLAQHKQISAIVTTAGGIEEDFIKCMAPTFVADFDAELGPSLRARGINRIGNLYVPNDNYCLFEDWIMPILDEMLLAQKQQGKIHTPSDMIRIFGQKINDPTSVYYWCAKNDIPVFCPAITDGSIGDMIYMHSYKNPGLIVDIAADVRRMDDIAVHSKGKTGMIILGGGLVKHHICNANMMRNGADFGVLVNTAQEFDGSDAGARPDEAKSWGKIKGDATVVKVYAEATLVFPLLVANTFVKRFYADSNTQR